MSLIDDLKAAHEAAIAPRRDAANYLKELMGRHAAEIIAALEERERLRAVVEAAQAVARYEHELRSGGGVMRRAAERRDFMIDLTALATALDALENA